jgi:hypothetical protein
MFDVRLCRLGCVMCGMVQMALCCVGMMRGGFVVACFVMASRLAMMPRCVFVMLRCFVMMLCRLLGHGSSLRFFE